MGELKNNARRSKDIVSDNYHAYKSMYPFKLLLRAMLTSDRINRQSLLNRQRDYLSLASNPELMKFHAVINELLIKANEMWDAYDYGQSYFYQGYRKLNISGLRDTEARIDAIGLPKLVAGKTVFEVGANSGFLSLELAENAQFVTGIEINPHLANIAECAADYLGVNNLQVIAESFEDYQSDERFDVLLSLANHSTYDGLTAQKLDEYFSKCKSLIKSDGLMVFESHPEGFEHPSLDHTFEVMSKYFMIEEKQQFTFGKPLDYNRTVAFARPIRTS